MITDLERIFQTSQPWPPESELPRLKRYTENEALFKGEHSKVFNVLLHIFSSHVAEHEKLIIVLNWHKRISTLWADFLVGRQPDVNAGDPGSVEQKSLEALLEAVPLWAEVYKAALDNSRFGNGLIKIRYDLLAGAVKVQAVHPSRWFPIQDSSGEVVAHLIAWEEERWVEHIKYTELICEIHRPGTIETRRYVLRNGKISGVSQEPQVQDTGVPGFLVVPFSNLQTSGEVFGLDDYGDLDSQIKRMESRLTRIGRILDVHSEPMMTVPRDAVKKDPYTGAVTYDSKRKIIPMDEGEKPPTYITWDGQLSAAFQEIDALMNQLYAISETCPQAFGQSLSGEGESGTSLRLRLVSPLKKVERLKLWFDPATKDLIRTISMLAAAQGMDGALPLSKISITWYDGLPEDETQVTANESMLVGAGLSSKKTAIKRIHGFNDEQAQAEIDQIANEGQSNQVQNPELVLQPM